METTVISNWTPSTIFEARDQLVALPDGTAKLLKLYADGWAILGTGIEGQDVFSACYWLNQHEATFTPTPGAPLAAPTITEDCPITSPTGRHCRYPAGHIGIHAASVPDGIPVEWPAPSPGTAATLPPILAEGTPMYGNDGRHKVAQAWIEGRAYSQGNVRTNGQDIYSYAHVVGITLRTGEKIAFCCHYSVTTAKHCNAFKAVANSVQPCAPHSRPVRTKYQGVCDCCRRHHPDYQDKVS